MHKWVMRGPRRRLGPSAIALLVYVALVLPTTYLTATGPRPAVGVQFHAMWGDYTDAERLQLLDTMAGAGIEWIRVDMGWASFQEQGPDKYSQWAIDRADFVVDAARERGMQVLGTLWRTPDWANGGAGPYEPPSEAKSFGKIALWAADHFKGRVAAWEVWNEPNLPDFFTGSAGDYVALLKAAYPQFKSGDPAAKVVLGGPSYNDTGWLEKVYDAGAQGSFDVMATHPYQAPADLPPEAADDGSIYRLSHVGAVHQLMTQHGDGDKEIWFTEFGWSTHDNTGDLPNWMLGVSFEKQGDFFVRTIDYLADKHPYVTNIIWYNERNRESSNVQLANYGLLNRDLSPKPGFAILAARLTGAAPPAEDTSELPTATGSTIRIDRPFGPAPPDSVSESTESTCYKFSPQELNVADQLTAARGLEGLGALELDPELSRVAAAQTTTMAKRRIVAPTPAQKLGTRVVNWKSLGQNVGAVKDTSRFVELMSMSPAQKQNVLDPAWHHVGIDVRTKRGNSYVVIVFESDIDPGTTLSMPVC
jgi:uncharacterized protein YkwD